MTVQRFGVSMESSLLEKFDVLIREKGYENRSQALRDMVREALVERQWADEGAEVAGTITLVYDHHTTGLSDLLNHLQHEYHQSIISTIHIHLDAHNCLEVLIVKGSPTEIRHLADRLISTQGVKHGRLTMTSTGRELD